MAEGRGGSGAARRGADFDLKASAGTRQMKDTATGQLTAELQLPVRVRVLIWGVIRRFSARHCRDPAGMMWVCFAVGRLWADVGRCGLCWGKNCIFLARRALG